MPLANADGRPVEIEYLVVSHQQVASFFSSRSRVRDGPAGGTIFPLPGRSAFMFCGFRADLLELAASQDFDRIAAYSTDVASIHKTIVCLVPKGEFSRFRIPEGQIPGLRESGGYVRFELEGLMRYSQEGLVFGALPIERRW